METGVGWLFDPNVDHVSFLASRTLHFCKVRPSAIVRLANGTNAIDLLDCFVLFGTKT